MEPKREWRFCLQVLLASSPCLEGRRSWHFRSRIVLCCLLLVCGMQNHHRNFAWCALLISGIHWRDGDQLCPEFLSFFGGRDLCHGAHLGILDADADLWLTLYIIKPARMARPASVGGSHHIGICVAD